jgi:hypothetical protein
VGQFKELVESAERDQPLQESLRKALNLTAKGWDGARKHALRAVTTDNRMRIWTADDSLSTGLLFRCNLGRILMDAPVGESALLFARVVLSNINSQSKPNSTSDVCICQ